MSDTKPTLTAAEFAAIGERVLKTVSTSTQVYRDRARLHAALERIQSYCKQSLADGVDPFCCKVYLEEVLLMAGGKSDAIDALFGGGK